jgi:hypothetical protein
MNLYLVNASISSSEIAKEMLLSYGDKLPKNNEPFKNFSLIFANQNFAMKKPPKNTICMTGLHKRRAIKEAENLTNDL